MPRSGLTAARLVDVAADLADEIGFDALTVSALARAVDVRPASLYSHLDGSDDIRRRVALLALEEMATAVGAVIAGRAGRDALVAMADSYRDYARAHPGRYDATRVGLDHATAMSSAGPRLSELTAAVLRGYPVPDADHPHAIRLLGSTLHGYIQLEAAGSFDHSPPSTEESWHRVVATLDASLEAWS